MKLDLPEVERENYRHSTSEWNTMMLNGNHTRKWLSVDKGIFAVSFGGGQVDITSGNLYLIAQKHMKLLTVNWITY